jgi:pilus assembly protein CpaC
MTLARGIQTLAAVILLLVCAGSALAADPADQRMIRLEMTIGKAQVVDLKDAFTRVSVTNPAIADVFVISPRQILVNGKAVGTTSLVVFYPDRTVFFDVLVNTDVGLLQERLKQIAPHDDIQVYPTQDAIVLSGNVSSSTVADAAVEIAALFAPKGKVVNLVGLTDVKPQQVMLQVQVAEVNRAALRELGFSARLLGRALEVGIFPGNPFALPIGSLGGILETTSTGATVVGASTPDFNFIGSNFFVSSPGRDYAGIARALAERNLFRTLAKPNLVTQSGKEAKFISGGEFPYPVSTTNNTIGVQFKEFGIGLVFTPVVVDGETINLRVLPEVSSLDFSQGLVSAGFRIPVVRKNQTYTTINIKNGESFAIAGLINNEVRQAVAKIPLLGDIPILGALFRSTRFQAAETELLFLVTVKIVKPEPPGTASTPDPTRLMDLRPNERKEFTFVPGIPGVGDVVERPFGESNLPASK